MVMVLLVVVLESHCTVWMVLFWRRAKDQFRLQHSNLMHNCSTEDYLHSKQRCLSEAYLAQYSNNKYAKWIVITETIFTKECEWITSLVKCLLYFIWLYFKWWSSLKLSMVKIVWERGFAVTPSLSQERIHGVTINLRSHHAPYNVIGLILFIDCSWMLSKLLSFKVFWPGNGPWIWILL